MTVKPPAFPEYVPATVRLRATELRQGARKDPTDTGWIGVLERLESERDNVERCLHDTGMPEIDLDTLRRRKLDLSAQIVETQRDLDCLYRLTIRPDRDLQRAYTLLLEDLQDEERVWSFIYAAIGANVEVARYRDSLKSARQCTREIAKLAEALAQQLQELERTGVHTPDLFWSVPALLGSADASGSNLVLWRQMRGRVLGEHRSSKDSEDASATSPIAGLEEDLDQDFPEDDFVLEELEDGASASPTSEQDQRYAWQVGPTVSDVVTTLADAAKNFEPREHHMIGAATAKRQDSEKAAYIRAFAHLLGVNRIDLTPGIKNAMATTATLVFNRHDLVVTLQDVGNTLSRA